MKNKYLLYFYFNEKHTIIFPVKAVHPEVISEKIQSLILNHQHWISFPLRDKFTQKFGSERITINLGNIHYFKVEIPGKSALEKYQEEDFISWDQMNHETEVKRSESS